MSECSSEHRLDHYLEVERTMKPGFTSVDVIANIMFGGQIALHITPKTLHQQWSSGVENIIVWGCFSAYGTGRLHIIGGQAERRKLQRHSWWESAAIYQDAEDETRVDISARHLSQTHSQGSAELVSEKENKAARKPQSIAWLESN